MAIVVKVQRDAGVTLKASLKKSVSQRCCGSGYISRVAGGTAHRIRFLGMTILPPFFSQTINLGICPFKTPLAVAPSHENGLTK